MLFDLRGRRRRLIQVVYAGLAVLMGGGLVFFGIGGSGTGLFDAFDSGGGGGGNNAFDERAEKLEARLRRDPGDEQLLLDLARTRAQSGQAELEQDPSTGQVTVTEAAVNEYGKAADAWEKYLRLEPRNPNPTAGILMARTYEALASTETSGPAAIADIEAAAEAQRIFAEARPSQGSLSQLAIYLYLAGKSAEADEVTKQALAKADLAQRQVLKQRLAAAKKQGKEIAKQLKAEAKAGQGQPGQNPLEDPTGGLGAGGLGSGAPAP